MRFPFNTLPRSRGGVPHMNDTSIHTNHLAAPPYQCHHVFLNSYRHPVSRQERSRVENPALCGAQTESNGTPVFLQREIQSTTPNCRNSLNLSILSTECQTNPSSSLSSTAGAIAPRRTATPSRLPANPLTTSSLHATPTPSSGQASTTSAFPTARWETPRSATSTSALGASFAWTSRASTPPSRTDPSSPILPSPQRSNLPRRQTAPSTSSASS